MKQRLSTLIVFILLCASCATVPVDSPTERQAPQSYTRADFHYPISKIVSAEALGSVNEDIADFLKNRTISHIVDVYIVPYATHCTLVFHNKTNDKPLSRELARAIMDFANERLSHRIYSPAAAPARDTLPDGH